MPSACEPASRLNRNEEKAMSTARILCYLVLVGMGFGSIVLGIRYSGVKDPNVINVTIGLCCLAFFVPSLFASDDAKPLSWVQVFQVFACVGAPWVIGTYFYTPLLQAGAEATWGVTGALALTQAIIVFGGVILFQDKINGVNVLGLMLIVAGIACMKYQPAENKQQPTDPFKNAVAATATITVH
jgi:drug/metabolite transporter (DMT)-like permease